MKARVTPGRGAPSRSEPLSPGRRRLFTLILIAFPLVLFLAAEAGLRWMNYGGDLKLVVRTSIAGREFLTLNREFGRKYFAGSATVTPEPSDDLFSIVKDAQTIRIFCLGESTMQGFPYEYHATAPAFLKDRLAAMMPHRRFEVVNAGLSAIGSVVVEDFLRELVDYQPDLILVYLGHNEFYGVYGVGSSLGSGSGWLARTGVRLLRFKTYLFLRDLYLRIRDAIRAEPVLPGATLMEGVVGRRAIPYGSPLYREARSIYEDNLRSIIGLAREHNVPIMFSTLVSNIGEQPPFVSAFDDGTDMDDRDAWQKLMQLGDSLEFAEAHESAIAAYSGAVKRDSMNASGFFALGRALAARQRFPEAKSAFERARDLDALRFRATGDFQQVLSRVCRSEGVPVARVDSAFDAASPHAIVGKNLILEHLHPNIDGYFLMAKVWVDAMRREHLLVSGEEWSRSRIQTDEELMAASTVSDFDRATGRIRVELLTRRWPFTGDSTAARFSPGDALETIVYRYIRGGLAWSEARYALAEEYSLKKRFEDARTECRAVSKVVPFSYQPLLRIADLYRQEGRNAQAKAAYRRCIAVEDNPFARMKLSIILLEERNPGAAAAEIEQALALVAAGKHRMAPGASATAHYMLAAAYAQLGKFSEARRNLEQALAIQSDFPEARALLRRLTGPLPRAERQ